MPGFVNQNGVVDDAVRLELAGQELLVAKEYDVSSAFLLTPNAFSITIGSGATAVDLMRAYPKRTPFKLKIGDVVQLQGRTDGYSRTSTGATEIQIQGRDCMAHLIDDHIRDDKSFTHATFEELVRACIEGSGIKGYSLVFDAKAQRSAVAGTPILEDVYTQKVLQKGRPRIENVDVEMANTLAKLDNLGLPKSMQRPLPYPEFEAQPAIVEGKFIKRVKGYRTDRPIKAKFGDTWYGFVHKELERGGLFLRGGVDPTGQDEFVFLLSEPSANQGPLYGLINARQGDGAANLVNVFPPRLHDTGVGRAAHFVVRGSSGGGKDGRKVVEGHFDDQEMIDLGYTTTIAVKRDEVKSQAHAEYIARKMCAESRRMHRTFTYSVRGHTLPMLRAPERRAVIVPDTCIYLRDDEHGIDGVFWIERVNYRGSADRGRTTEMVLMVPEDLVFGEGEFQTNRKKKTKVFGGTTKEPKGTRILRSR